MNAVTGMIARDIGSGEESPDCHRILMICQTMARLQAAWITVIK
jgi:hypothetical protein